MRADRRGPKLDHPDAGGPTAPLGTYLVSYRVISADSHPVSGAFTFSVGAPSASVAERRRVSGSTRWWRSAVPTANYLGYLGLTLVVRPALVLALLWPRRLPRVAASGWCGSDWSRWVCTAGTLWLQAPYSAAPARSTSSLTELAACWRPRPGWGSPAGWAAGRRVRR